MNAGPGQTQHHTAFKSQLGDALIAQGVITRQQLDQALEEQAGSGHNKLLGEMLIELGFVTEAQVMEALAKSYGVPFARITLRVPAIARAFAPVEDAFGKNSESF